MKREKEVQRTRKSKGEIWEEPESEVKEREREEAEAEGETETQVEVEGDEKEEIKLQEGKDTERFKNKRYSFKCEISFSYKI